MIRAALLGAFGLGLTVFAIAQETTETETSDLETTLFGTEGAIPPVQNRTYQQYDTVTLRALDKITGRSTDFEMRIDEPKVYGSLRVDLDVCFQTPPEEPPESAAFLRVTSASSKQVQTMAVPRDLSAEELAASEGEDADVRFTGWMFASSPGLSALEHPVYDIWVIACSEVDPSVLNPALPNE